MPSRSVLAALATAFVVAVSGLLWLSYRSVTEWQRSARLLAEHKAETMLTLLSGAISRDMKGAETSLLMPLEIDDVLHEPPYEVREIAARGFARFPYAESFFLLKSRGRDRVFYLFNRENRLPPWDPVAGDRLGDYPAGLKRNPPAGRTLERAVLEQAARGGRFMVFDCALSDTPYQIVAKTLRSATPGGVIGIVGFTVNLQWVRRWYFPQLAAEVSRVGDVSVPLAIADSEGVLIASVGPFDSKRVVRRRQFLPMFSDPAVAASRGEAVPGPAWTAMVEAADDRVLLAATRGNYVMLAVAALASLIGVLLTARAVRTRAMLTAMQSDFVSTVTHELKTPLAFIRLLGETLGEGRIDSLDRIREYARLLSQEAWRLTWLVENLLTFARVSEKGRAASSLEPLEVAELVEDALGHFRPVLADRQFTVVVDLPPDLPTIRGDRATLTHALDNLVDNAIKYSDEQRALTIRSWVENNHLHIDVADRGRGIASEDIPKIFDKFYRGQRVRTGGSGLGLAIVKQVMEEHRGSVQAVSGNIGGTALRLTFPLDASHG